MYATVRQYPSVGAGTFEQVLPRQQEIEAVLRGVPGFVSYQMLRTGDGMTSVTVCQDQAGVEESNRAVARWIIQNIPTFMPTAPQITAGEVVMAFAAQ
jgi:antibiotic biosynthesis monooxygenase (ABM) superfamily enzyme